MEVTHGGNLFAVAEQHGWDWRDVLDFSASINPLGHAPGVRAAIEAALARIAHYPPREPQRLTEALAARWNVRPEWIMAGNGATELLHFHARVARHERVTLLAPVFSEFHRAYPSAACAPWNAPERWPTDGLLVLTQPNNPLGLSLPYSVLRQCLLTGRQPVLVDESFLEFTEEESVLRLVGSCPHLVVLRSLTKFEALPGLRVGALVSQAVPQWRRQREPWQVSVLAEAAALAAISDQTHAARSRAFVDAERAWLSEQLAALPGVRPYPSCANFLLVTLDYSSAALATHLLSRRILVRDCTGWPGVPENAVRIAVRTRAENERLLAAWKEFPCD